MPELPSGTVTLLFTDIEGSTKLLHDLGGEAFDELLREHRTILRDAFGAHDGVELRTEGDSFFAAFAIASDAVSAAAQAQRELTRKPLRVRMGIHTGRPLRVEHEDGYVGIDVHRAARIASAAHGGQVLLSQPTRDLLENELELCDLGRHRLKDIAEPERLYQLGRAPFPPLRTLNQASLPTQLTKFIGRERELEELLALVRAPDVRLLTLTGPGGTGKTRLALAAAAAFATEAPDGSWFVPLAAVRDPSLLLSTIAQALGAKEPETLQDHLRDKDLLLVLDNLEQLLEAAPMVAELLNAAPKIRILATSRAPLRISGEHEYPVEPLSEAEAEALFVERARAVQPAFEPVDEVAEICLRLDKLPLAIELAAARVKLLSPSALLERLEQRLPLLTGGARDAPERQQTLRAAIDWSRDLLSVEERALFARLAVFVGGWTLEATEAVCQADLDTLQSLVEKSLVRASRDRFEMLRTIREYAAEQLQESGDAELSRRRHTEYFVAYAEEAEPLLNDTKQAKTFERFALDYPNLRAALEAGDPEERLRIAAAIWSFWQVRGPISEGRAWLDRALEESTGDEPALPGALRGAGVLAHRCGDYAAARAHFEANLRAVERTGDPHQLGRSWSNLGIVAESEGRTDEARALFERAAGIAKEHDDEPVYSAAISNLSDLAAGAEDYAEAERLAREALELDRRLGDDQSLAVTLLNLGDAVLRQGRAGEAWPALLESLEFSVRLGDIDGIGYSLQGLSEALAALGEARDAARLLGAAIALREQLGTWPARPVEHRNYERLRSGLTEELGEDDLDAATAEGAALGAEEAAAAALALEPKGVLSRT